MSDQTDKILPRLQQTKVPGLNLPPELIHPQYGGYSILNIPNSICKLLGAPPKNRIPALDPEILDPLGENIQKVLVILMDALALHRLRNWIDEHPEIIWGKLVADGLLAPITSISPSTTSAAMTTYWTDTAPFAHGITGYEMWLKEYGMVVNSILHTPMSFKSGGAGILEKAGFSPEEFLPVSPLDIHLAQHGIESHVFQHYAIINSGLSQMFFREVTRHGIASAADLWHSILELWQKPASSGKTFAWAYWSNVDTLGHYHGPDDPRSASEFTSFSRNFAEIFLNQLSPDERKGTLVILTADHGQITTDKFDPHYELCNHPEFLNLLHIKPTGENRLAFLHTRPGQSAAVREYVDQTWPGQFTLLESQEAAEKGLFGPGTMHPDLPNRIGDLTAVAHRDAFWWWGDRPNPIVGRHGGLGAQEMLVPFLAARL
ncbi:MAG: alkaline phosphatase family protein [Anaerolineales bacterium]|nr:alkaline phosphatase family protein [Anaerolineales bacterium]